MRGMAFCQPAAIFQHSRLLAVDPEQKVEWHGLKPGGGAKLPILPDTGRSVGQVIRPRRRGKPLQRLGDAQKKILIHAAAIRR